MQFPYARTYFRKSELVKLRSKALRRRVWFNTLNRIERGLINSVIKVVDMVRSTLLAKVLTAIVKKLLTTLESKVSRMIREIGLPLAKKISLPPSCGATNLPQNGLATRASFNTLRLLRSTHH